MDFRPRFGDRANFQVVSGNVLSHVLQHGKCGEDQGLALCGRIRAGAGCPAARAERGSQAQNRSYSQGFFNLLVFNSLHEHSLS